MNRSTQRIVILVSLVAVIGLFALFLKDILVPYIKLEAAHDLDGAKELLVSKGILGFFTVVLVEALQMVVVFIPAEFIQISSGMSYPFYIALLLCDLGVCLGATIIYVLVHAFGFTSSAAEKNEEKIRRLAKGSGRERSVVLLLYFLFIMPLIPFGAICYYGSRTRIRYPRYLLTVATGVIPSIITSNLMGEAAKYFIGNSLPLPLLILMIALLGAALFVTLALFLDKVYFKENDGTPDSVIYTAFFRLARLLRGGKQKLKVSDELVKDLEPPFIILCNHESFWDFYYIRALFPNVPFAIVANRHVISRPIIRRLARRAGFIGKRLFNADFTASRGIFRMVKAGYSVAVFPEGRLSLTGREYPVIERGGRLYKKLGVPIAVCHIGGAYFSKPKWRRRFYRSEISVSARRVISAEEAASLSAEDLDAIMQEALRYDESEARANLYPGRRDLAEGLENVLYRCADCGALYSTVGRGREFCCTACGAKLTLGDDYRFTEDPRTIDAYYERIKALERSGLRGFRLETEVTTVIFSEKGRFRRRGPKGICTLTEEGLSFSSETVRFTVERGRLPALPFSCGEEFEVYHEDELWYFYPVRDRCQVARWALMVDLMYEEDQKTGAIERRRGAEPRKDKPETAP